MLGNLSSPASEVFQFSRGLALAAGEEARLRGFLADALADERVAVTIVGHTGDAGDTEANQTLSVERAEMVRQVAAGMGIAPARMNAQGVGGAAALPKQDGESARAYQARLARVEVALQMRR